MSLHFNNRRSVSVSVWICGAILIAALSACSSGDSADTEEPVNANGEDSETVNSTDTADPKLANNKNSPINESESVNNVPDNEFADTSTDDQSLNLGNNPQNAATSNPSALVNDTAVPTNNTATASSNILPANLTAPTNPAAPANGAAAPVNAALNAAATPAAPQLVPPTGTGVVKYVRMSTPISEQIGGPAVGMLEQGDHPVVWEDGQTAKLSDGKVLPLGNLSERGVGRARSERSWNSGG